MSKVFISPCGTSLLTNSTEKNLRNLLFSTANSPESALEPNQKKIISQHIQQRREQLIEDHRDLATVKQLSAELNGIITYYEGQITNRGEDIHWLMATDTYQGKQTANIVAYWLNQHGITAYVEVIKDLATKELDSFRVAMSELVEWCDTITTSYQAPHYQLVFNLTGGFKSVNGFLQVIGMFYGAEIIYIFQFSSQLLRIPRLPISFNTETIINKHLNAFRKMRLKQSLSEQECQSIPETLLFQIDNQVRLSEWGQLIWQQAKAQYFSEVLLEPLSETLVYSEQFKKDVKGMQPDQLKVLNEKLDDLSWHLHNPNYNPKGLNFKAIKGNPSPPSTHECDIWGGQEKRLFGHFEAKQYWIDRLGVHL